MSQSTTAAIKNHLLLLRKPKTKKPFCELSDLSQQMAMKGTSAGTSADVCVCVCLYDSESDEERRYREESINSQ